MKHPFHSLRITVMCLALLLFIFGQHAHAGSNGVYLNLDLDFFNRFNQTNPYTDTFQRYHMLTLGYQQDDWQGQFTYNWYDQVNSAVSTHTITPWGLEGRYRLDHQQSLELAYWWVTDLTDAGNDTQVLRAQYSRHDRLDDKWQLQSHIGLKLINYTLLLPLLGGTVVYNDRFRLGLNDLDPVNDHLFDDLDGSLNLPVNVGYTYRFNPYVSLDLDYYQFLLPPTDDTRLRWFRTSFNFTMW